MEKSTYPALLHEKLQAGNSGIRVINMAADGWSSHQGLALLKHKAVEYSPDIAIFCFGINDADQFWNEPDTEKAKSFDSAIVSIRRTLSSSLVYFSIQKIFLKVRGYIFGKTPMGMPESEPSRRVSLQQYKLNLEDITETCRKHQITPIFLLLPLNPYYNWSHWANSGESTGAWESNLDSLLSGYENQSQDHLISALKDLVAKKPLSYTARFALGNAIRKSGKAEEAHREFLALLDRVIFSEYTRASRKFAKEASVHLVDLTEDFHSFENSLFIDDMHPNALGAELIAQRMDDRIREFLSNGKSD